MISNLEKEIDHKYTKTTDIVRGACLIAKHLGDYEILEEFEREIRGYTDKNNIPDYRKVDCDVCLLDLHKGFISIKSHNGDIHIEQYYDKSIKDIEQCYYSASEKDIKIGCALKKDSLKHIVLSVDKIKIKMILDSVRENVKIWVKDLSERGIGVGIR